MMGLILGALLLPVMAVLCLADLLTLPEDLKTISEEAFYGDSSLDEVVLPEGIERIESRAFANTSVKKVYFPDSLNYIAPDAFSGSTQVTGWGNAGTYAADYCQRRNIPYEASGVEMTISGKSVYYYRPFYAEGSLMPAEIPLTLHNAPVNTPVVWHSSDTDIAIVSSSGVVSPQGKGGTVIITAEAGGAAAQHELTIETRFISTAWNMSEYLQADGSWNTIAGTGVEAILPFAGIGEYVSWTSDNPAVVSIISNSYSSNYVNLFFDSEGTAVLTAECESGSASVTIHVGKAPDYDNDELVPVFYNSSLEICPGQFSTVNLNTYPYSEKFVYQKEDSIVWSSGNNDIIHVYGEGTSATVVGIQEGVTELIASCGGSSAVMTVTVADTHSSPLQINIPTQVTAGKTVYLRASGGLKELGYFFSSSDESVAVIEAGDRLTGLKAGTCEITVCNGEAAASAVLEVTEGAGEAGETGLSLRLSGAILRPGSTGNCYIDGYAGDYTQSPEVVSSDPSVVEVTDLRLTRSGSSYDNTITFKCRKAGTAVLTLDIDGQTASVDVTVQKPGITLRYPESRGSFMAIGDEMTLIVSGTDGTETVSWSSSNPLVASVDAEGTVSALSPGRTTITASAGTASESLRIIVDESSGGSGSYMRLVMDERVYTPGETGWMYRSGIGYDDDVVYSSSDPSVAEVDDYGTLYLLAPGTAVITARSGSLSDSVTVHVLALEDLPLLLSSYENSMQTIYLYENGVLNGLTAKNSSANAVWSFSDPGIAELEDNDYGEKTIRGLAAGSTVLTITDGNRSLAVPVTVLQNTLPLVLTGTISYDKCLWVGQHTDIDVKNTPPEAELQVTVSDPSVAEIVNIDSARGSFELNPLKEGSVTLTVQAGNKTVTKTLEVKNRKLILSSGSSLFLYEGGNYNFYVEDAVDPSLIEWNLEDNGTGASLQTGGSGESRAVLKAGSAGTVTLTATCGIQTASKTLRIRSESEAPMAVMLYRDGAEGGSEAIDNGYHRLTESDTQACVSVRNLPAGASVSWISDDESVLQVSGDGGLTVLKSGYVNLTAVITYSGGLTENLTGYIYASFRRLSLEVSPANGYYAVGTWANLSFGDNLYWDDVELSFSDPSMVYRNDEYPDSLYLVKEGTLTITAECGAQHKEVTIEIGEGELMKIYEYSLLSNCESVSVFEGENFEITVENNADQISCVSDNEDVICVTEAGYNYAWLTAVGAGTATVTISDGYMVLERQIRVIGTENAGCPVFLDYNYGFFADAYDLKTERWYTLYIRNFDEDGTVTFETDSDMLTIEGDWGFVDSDGISWRGVYISTSGQTGDAALTAACTPEDASGTVKTAAVTFHIQDDPLTLSPSHNWNDIYTRSIYGIHPEGLNGGTELQLSSSDPSVAEFAKGPDDVWYLYTYQVGQVVITAEALWPDGEVNETFEKTITIRPCEYNEPALECYSVNFHVGEHIYLYPMYLPEGVEAIQWLVSDPTAARINNGDMLLLGETSGDLTVTAVLSDGSQIDHTFEDCTIENYFMDDAYFELSAPKYYDEDNPEYVLVGEEGNIYLLNMPWKTKDLTYSLSAEGIISAGEMYTYGFGSVGIPVSFQTPGTVTVTVTSPVGEEWTTDIHVSDSAPDYN